MGTKNGQKALSYLTTEKEEKMIIGETITGGTDDRILYQASGSLAESPRLLFDGTNFIVTYDGSNYFTVSVSSTGVVTLNAVGSGSKFTFSDDVEVPDEAYGTSWNGSPEIPTKNAVYDIIEVLFGNRIFVQALRAFSRH